MRSTLAFALVFASLSTTTGNAQRTSALNFERGSLDQRIKVIQEVLQVPPDRRDPEVWKAMSREATRTLSDYRRHTRVSQDDQYEQETYAGYLVRGLAESGEPSAMPVVVEFAGLLGRETIDIILHLGEQAVPAMLQVARRPDDDLNARGGISTVFAELLRPRPGAPDPMLSQKSRDGITAFAAQILVRDSKLRSYEIANLVRVALATGRADLRTEVERLANEQSAWAAHGVTNPGSIAVGQRACHAELRLTASPK